MRAPVSHRFVRLLAALGLAGALLLPASRCPPGRPTSNLVLRVGTVQKLETLNPWHSLMVVDYEVFQLSYNLLVELRPEPRAGARASPTSGSRRPTR